MSRSATQSKLQFKSQKSNAESQLINNKNNIVSDKLNNNNKDVVINTVNSQPIKPKIESTVKTEIDVTSPKPSTITQPINNNSTKSPNKRTKNNKYNEQNTIDLSVSDTREQYGILPNTWLDAGSDEIILREFDMNMSYGPCSGLTRRERYNRAKNLGLNPPQQILDILDRHPETSEQNNDNNENDNVSNIHNTAIKASPNKKSKQTTNALNHVSATSIFENPAARVLENEYE